MPFVDTNNLLTTKVKPYNFDINTIPKAMSDTVFFGTNFGGGQIFYSHWEDFTTRESTLVLTG